MVQKIPTNNIQSVTKEVMTVRQGRVAYGPGVAAHGEHRFWKMLAQVWNDYQVQKSIRNLGRVHKSLKYFSRRNHELSSQTNKFKKLCTTRIVKYFLIRHSHLSPTKDDLTSVFSPRGVYCTSQHVLGSHKCAEIRGFLSVLQIIKFLELFFPMCVVN